MKIAIHEIRIMHFFTKIDIAHGILGYFRVFLIIKLKNYPFFLNIFIKNIDN